MRRSHFAALLALLPALFCGAARAGDFGATVEKEGLLTRDAYALGGTAVVHATVKGDVTAVGAVVDVANEIFGDVLAIGGRLNLNARVHDDVRAAGGTVVLNGQIGDDAVLLGDHVIVDRGAIITGRGLLAGKTVEINGRVQGNLHVAAHSVVVRGEIVGDADIMADWIEIAPGARVRGNLVYTSAHDIQRSADSQLLGTVTHSGADAPRWRLPDLNARVFMGVSVFFTAAVLVLLLPRATSAVARRLVAAPWPALGAGVLAIFITPVLGFLLMLSAIGVWLALIFSAAWVLAIVAGYVIAVLSIADVALRELRGPETPRIPFRLAAVAVVLAILTALSWMPFVYFIATGALVAFGTGALCRVAFTNDDSPASHSIK